MTDVKFNPKKFPALRIVNAAIQNQIFVNQAHAITKNPDPGWPSWSCSDSGQAWEPQLVLIHGESSKFHPSWLAHTITTLLSHLAKVLEHALESLKKARKLLKVVPKKLIKNNNEGSKAVKKVHYEIFLEDAHRKQRSLTLELLLHNSIIRTRTRVQVPKNLLIASFSRTTTADKKRDSSMR